MDADGLPLVGPGIDYTKVDALGMKPLFSEALSGFLGNRENDIILHLLLLIWTFNNAVYNM